VLIALTTLISCGESITPGKLKGNTYNIDEYYIVDGLDYATWLNLGDINKNSFTGVSGTWSFTKDDKSTINMNYLVPNIFNPEELFQAQLFDVGELVMNGRQDFFDVDWQNAGYNQYFVAENGGKTLTIAWDVPIGFEGQVHFIVMTKD